MDSQYKKQLSRSWKARFVDIFKANVNFSIMIQTFQMKLILLKKSSRLYDTKGPLKSIAYFQEQSSWAVNA